MTPPAAAPPAALPRAGADVVVVERARFARFQVGESLLPRVYLHRPPKAPVAGDPWRTAAEATR